ncbi:MAG: SDR family NAD(P)-dependent oxidoreductase [Acidimicrobiales bacterium]
MSARSVLDAMLEATVIGSFTKIGPAVRSRLYEWDDEVPGVAGLSVLITGGSSGLGRETARRLVEGGATVYLTSRDRARAEQVATEINAAASDDSTGTAIGAELDTADPDSVKQLADRIKLETDTLDVLIHNAGALTDTYATNENDIELTLASHLVGPYALTKHLRPHLSKGARVLWMSSGGMYTQGLDVDEIEMSEDDYRGAIAYARAKRGQVELVKHLGPKWAPDVIMHTMHPGWVDTDGVAQGLPGFGRVMGPLLRDVGDGADTMVWLAAGGADDADPGLFWLDRRPRATSYLPGTGTDDDERERLVEWLDLTTLPWKVA